MADFDAEPANANAALGAKEIQQHFLLQFVCLIMTGQGCHTSFKVSVQHLFLLPRAGNSSKAVAAGASTPGASATGAATTAAAACPAEGPAKLCTAWLLGAVCSSRVLLSVAASLLSLESTMSATVSPVHRLQQSAHSLAACEIVTTSMHAIVSCAARAAAACKQVPCP